MTDNAAPADDADDYEDEPEEDKQGAAFLDLAVNTLAGGVAGVVGYAVGGPGGAVVGNTATPYLATVFQKVVRPFWEDQSRRAEKMLETAAETAGPTREELADRAVASEESRFLTHKAIQAAADTIWPEGVRAIGRAYAAGLLAKDKPSLDIRLRALGIMEDLDEMHVRLLDLLVRYEPEVGQQKYVSVPHRYPSYCTLGGDRKTFTRADGPDGPGVAGVWAVGNRIWATPEISSVMPEIKPVLASLLGELRESGLAKENDTAPGVAKQVRDYLTEQVNNQAEEMQRTQRVGPIKLKKRRIRHAKPTWSPTELGETILGFYGEAGAEDSQDPGGHPGQATS
jgi:hypothetical protein